MSFSQQLRQEADPIFEAIYSHPFLQEIAKGVLGKEQLIHYVKQDFEYLNAYMRVYGLGISKCTERRDIKMFHDNIDFVLNSESHPHHNFCNVAGVTYEELQGYALSPTAQHYTRYMLSVAAQGTLGEIYAVLAPCPWTYIETAERIVANTVIEADHPFYEWIMFYGDGTMRPNIESLCERLDNWAVTAPIREKEQMLAHYIASCQLEYKFFDMAYKLEEWPVDRVGELRWENV